MPPGTSTRNRSALPSRNARKPERGSQPAAETALRTNPSRDQDSRKSERCCSPLLQRLLEGYARDYNPPRSSRVNLTNRILTNRPRFDNCISPKGLSPGAGGGVEPPRY